MGGLQLLSIRNNNTNEMHIFYYMNLTKKNEKMSNNN